MIAARPTEGVLTEPEKAPPPEQPPDRTLRLMLTWVGIALVVALILAFIGVELAFWLFDR